MIGLCVSLSLSIHLGLCEAHSPGPHNVVEVRPQKRHGNNQHGKSQKLEEQNQRARDSDGLN